MSRDSETVGSQTDWKRIHAMRDEDIDLSEAPEVSEDDLQGAVLRVGGKPVAEERYGSRR